MADLRSVLDEATDAALISSETSEKLLPFLMDRGVVVRQGALRAQPGRPHTLAEEPLSVEPDTETPRFVRGFHDILITIGVVILLSGLRGIASLYMVLPAILLLSEVLVRRQRLALPAVALTIAVFAWTGKFMTLGEFGVGEIWRNNDFPVFFLSGFPIALGLYYLRYRVPLSFALCVISGLVLLLAAILSGVRRFGADPLFPADSPGVFSAILLFSALSLFAVALYFDLSDIRRVTRRSDIAFWLQLGAAPALLYSTIFLFSRQGTMLDMAQSVSARTPTVVITVVALMLIGLVIDRRAFVTAGLLSLGVAIYGVFRNGGASVDTYLYLTLLTVGVIVLIIGIGWVPLRRLALRLLPQGLSSRLPPAL